MTAQHEGPHQLEFPVLVYREDGDYVAESLLTSTVAVSDNIQDALREVAQLVLAELEAAEEYSQGDWGLFSKTLYCPTPNDKLWEYYSRATRVQFTPAANGAGSGSKAHIVPKEVAALA